MQLRRFTADSTPAALGAVRLALGDDAIILANRKIGEQVEIIATGQMEDAQALADMSMSMNTEVGHEDVKTTTNGATANLISGNRVRSEQHNVGSTTIEELNAAVESVEQNTAPLKFGRIQQPNNSGDNPVADSPDRQYVRRSTRATSQPITDADALAALNTQKNREPSVRQTPPVVESVDKEVLREEMQEFASGLNETVARQNEQLMQIVKAQGAMVDQYFKGLEVNLWGSTSPNRRLHLQKLFALGIGAELAVKLVERSDPEASVDDALRRSFALLKSTLPIAVDKTFSVPGVTIFSGPTGAGKTTALMKIATSHVKEHGSDSIVIICADTRRIGAFEELQAYGRLLGVPTVHAHDSSELDSLLSAFTHKQLVLIDHTLPMDEDAVEIPKRLLEPASADSVRQLLVLSATSQSATLDSLLSRYGENRSAHCVLTHLDADARLGEMFNAIIRHNVPIAYWSDAASVQKPLQRADASTLIATAAAMSRRLPSTPDDEWLLRLIQPTDKMMSYPGYSNSTHEVKA